MFGFIGLMLVFGALFTSIALQSKAGGGDGNKTFSQWVDEMTKNLKDSRKTVFGAIPGNSIDGNVIQINGIDNYYYEQAMTSAGLNGGIATGTACVILLPSASTTLVDYNAIIQRNAPTTTAKFAVYNTIGGYATTSDTAIGGISDTIAANGRLIATATQATTTTGAGMFLRGSNGGEDNSFLVFDIEGGSRWTGTGVCRAHLREL